MIIGLTGLMGSGKGEAVNVFKRFGFRHVTLSSLIREEAGRRGAPETRDELVKIGNELRREGGAGILARLALKKVLDGGGDWVIDGIRNPAEIEELRKNSGTKIIGLKVNEKLIIKRILGRSRAGDAVTAKDILKKLQREKGVGEPKEGQQVGKCLKMADKIIKNEGSLKKLEQRLIEYYNSLRDMKRIDMKRPHKTARPSKDEYYLDLAKSVCRRATCLKVEIGAVIIKDDQVVATGYCGSPRGTKSSLEHGFCLRVHLGIPSGHRYEMCRSVHAEQNAIINAARAGVSLLGGDMYIYGKRRGENGGNGEAIDAFPCFICKKMLINCGLQRVVCSLADGGFKIFLVADWIRDWQERDIIDDAHQYGEKVKS